MKTYILSICLLLGLVLPIHAQSEGKDISEVWQTYYFNPDPELIPLTISFLNETTMTGDQLAPALFGFYGALFKVDTLVRAKFRAQRDELTNPEMREMFAYIDSLDIDDFVTKIVRDPAYNDLNWAAFFSTGDSKYLDNIIDSVPYSDEREDMMLFMAGMSAKWSLASNASQYEKVRAYLESLDLGEAYDISGILSKDPGAFQEEMVEILKAQKAAGVWGQ